MASSHKVERDNLGTYINIMAGDTCYSIVNEFKSSHPDMSVDTLKVLNSLNDKYTIKVNQKLYLTKTGSPTPSDDPMLTSVKVKLEPLGLDASDTSGKTLLATWSCSRDIKEIKEYEYVWEYDVGNKTDGNIVWHRKTGKTDAEECYSTFSIPDQAIQIKFKVKPISNQKDNGNNQSVDYFSGSWVQSSVFYVKDTPPPVPSPSKPEFDPDTMMLKIEIDKYPLEDYEIDSTTERGKLKVETQIIANDGTLFRTISNKVFNKYGYLSFETSVTAGNRYKVRSRARRGSLTSVWSAFTENVSSTPLETSIDQIRAVKNTKTGTTDIYIEWAKSNTADGYDIQYAAVLPGEKPNFDASNDENIKTQTTTGKVVDGSGGNKLSFTLDNVESGLAYYFRIAAKLGSTYSKWSEISEQVIVGSPPAAPNVWSSSTKLIVGEPLYLYWVHNPTDGSAETSANIQIEMWQKSVDADGKPVESWKYTIDYDQPKSDLYEDQYTTSFCDFNELLSKYPLADENFGDGITLRWRVRTAGISKDYGDDVSKHWSTTCTVDVYASPELKFTVQPGNDYPYETDFECECLPLTIYASAESSSQIPKSYHISITSNDVYETVDNVGNTKTVSVGDVIYSKTFDNQSTNKYEIEHGISAGDVNLFNTASYKIECVVSMDSGLTVSKSMNFSVKWSEDSYEPTATVIFDPVSYTTSIQPYCEEILLSYYKVVKSGTKYIATTEGFPDVNVFGTPAKDHRGKRIYTTTGEAVFSGLTSDFEGNIIDDNVYYYEFRTGLLIEGVTLSVYRRDFDGRFTEIATNIDNTKNTFVTDPHPALDYARYRIVSTNSNTGVVSYTDLPGVYIGEPGIILQWNESWSSFDVDPDITDALSKPNWAGSLLRLPYNIDVAPSYTVDTTFIRYAGRQHPVSYYGTQIGETATWNTAIPKSDKETIYALHRLAKWTGNVYAREPSGVGYWANITVQFPQKHLDNIVSVSLTLTRVEGGL